MTLTRLSSALTSRSPLTHARFLRRVASEGTYGPRDLHVANGTPTPTSPYPGLYVVGDSTWPGIGTPAAAATGMWVANTLVDPFSHARALDLAGL